jgi:RNA polymerase sigma-70 factor (ECF subfamily)
MNRPAGRTERLYIEVASEFGAALERLARGYERDPDKRRDLLQEIHLALWRSLARFDSRCSMRTWVYRVAHNVATSHVIRPKASAPRLVASDDLESLADAADRPTIAAEDLLDRQRTLDRLYELIHQLRPMDRQVMLLYLEDVEAATIAEITGLTAVNVATKIHRIKQLLTRRFHGRSAARE